MDEAMKKTDATVLGIIYHPELRDISGGAKKGIAEMVRTLSGSLIKPGYCRVVRCVFADKCNSVCDWAKGGNDGGI